MSQTSVGPGPNRGGNENPADDPRRKTLGEGAPQAEPPAGAPGTQPQTDETDEKDEQSTREGQTRQPRRE
ncbi:hypothetical protein JI739_00695 [Ramlibacter sp. AW1]|uniref:Uncharacterized protein n=1 Tax=Ramlibacter aurantiacus TaxID=2801330 RepID=A0A937D323_9BURK|nr:hypothetical protein [Ramlibacter aurantiacus]MBL0418852.1 hypothetical protein [Ramlibacter aurantiacus]